MLDLVIHVHENRNVDQISWQLRIVRFTKADHDILQSKFAYPLAQALQILGHDVFRDDAALGSNDRRESYDVVAATGADVRDSHPGFDPEQAHELARFVGTIGLGKGDRRRA